MKIFFFIIALLFVNQVFAQNVGIGNTNPDASALLDLTATDKGILIPRMTSAEKNAIATPATGLLIYQTDGTAGFYYFDGTAWTLISNVGDWKLDGNTVGTNRSLGTNDNFDLLFETFGTEKMRLTTAGNLGIGTSNPTTFITARKDHNNPTTLMVQNSTAGTVSEAALLLQSNTGSLDLEAISSSYSGFGVLVANTGRVRSSTGMTNGLYMGTGNGPIVLFTGDSEKARLNTAGNFGIGNTNPTYKLDITGNDYFSARFSAPSSPLIKLSGSYNAGNGAEFWQDGTGDARINISSTLNSLYLKSNGEVGIGMSFPSVPQARLDINNGTSTNPILIGRDNGTEVFRIADGGFVGIGTNNPTTNLEINVALERVKS